MRWDKVTTDTTGKANGHGKKMMAASDGGPLAPTSQSVRCSTRGNRITPTQPRTDSNRGYAAVSTLNGT
eukprot:10514140-Lingulodinium_polyedra.AAC.1